MRDMTLADRMRLKAHRASHKLFQKLLEGTPDGTVHKVCDLTATQWVSLRTLVELGYVSIEDGRVMVELTITSLSRLGYV